jgi:exportin-2 (importin alpha re-exporter)
LDVLLRKIESASTAEKMAENDHLIKCLFAISGACAFVDVNNTGVMRVIVTARQTLITGYEQTLNRLVSILGVISKNPSNPNFDQYIFESISGLMRLDHHIADPLFVLTIL